MKLSLTHKLLAQMPLSTDELQVLLGSAEALRRAAAAGIEQPLLRGKNIAVLCNQADCAAAEAFTRAATRLGARVARISPDTALQRGEADAERDTARLLGRLYDAVECDELPDEVVHRLQRSIGVPVYNGLARRDHPLQRQLPAEADPDYVLQALLVATLA
ncbi:hypothetical protein [Aquabacterium sp.]|uniref:hypothetical protein n=1 Tax=Aquabacterium sp. TaxID=1872578 RepID=UPI0037850F44